MDGPENDSLGQPDGEDGKRHRRGAISDVPSVVMDLDLGKFPPKSPEVVEVLARAAAVNPLLKTLEREDCELLFRAMFEVHMAIRRSSTASLHSLPTNTAFLCKLN